MLRIIYQQSHESHLEHAYTHRMAFLLNVVVNFESQ